MADPTPAGDGLDPIVEALRSNQKQTRELGTASGTQRARAVERLEELLEELQGVVDQQASQIAFLQTQTVGDQRIGVSGGSKPGVAGYAYQDLDLAFDCQVSVTTGASGKLIVAAGGAVTASGAGAGIGPHVIGGALPDFSNSAAAGEGSVVGASRTVLFSLAPNTAYTINTRRWFYGGTAQFVSFQNASLVVTRLG